VRSKYIIVQQFEVVHDRRLIIIDSGFHTETMDRETSKTHNER
jgi:hypothetical protein